MWGKQSLQSRGAEGVVLCKFDASHFSFKDSCTADESLSSSSLARTSSRGVALPVKEANSVGSLVRLYELHLTAYSQS